jgi:hypothetical protein
VLEAEKTEDRAGNPRYLRCDRRAERRMGHAIVIH